MGPKIDPKVFNAVKAVCAAGLTYKKILKQLRYQKITISISTYYRIKNSIGKRNQVIDLGLPQPPNRYPQKMRKPTLSRKIAPATTKENLASQNQLAEKCKVLQHTINRSIHNDLSKKTLKMKTVHALQPRHHKIRKSTSRTLYRIHLAGKKSNFL